MKEHTPEDDYFETTGLFEEDTNPTELHRALRIAYLMGQRSSEATRHKTGEYTFEQFRDIVKGLILWGRTLRWYYGLRVTCEGCGVSWHPKEGPPPAECDDRGGYHAGWERDYWEWTSEEESPEFDPKLETDAMIFGVWW